MKSVHWYVGQKVRVNTRNLFKPDYCVWLTGTIAEIGVDADGIKLVVSLDRRKDTWAFGEDEVLPLGDEAQAISFDHAG